MRRDGRLHGNWSPFYSVTNHRESIWGRRGRGDEGLTQTLHPGSWQPSLFTMVMHKRKNATQSSRPGFVPVTLALDSSALGGWKCDLQIFFLMGDAAAGQHCSKAVRRLQSICLHFFHYILFFCIFSYQCLSSTSPLLYLGFLKRATVFLWALLTQKCNFIKSIWIKTHQSPKFSGEGWLFKRIFSSLESSIF